jgi:hypothetical protein
MAAPLVKDPDRIPAVSTLRRWFQAIDLPELEEDFSPRPVELPLTTPPQMPFPFLRKTLQSAMGSPGNQKHRLRSLCMRILLPLRI